MLRRAKKAGAPAVAIIGAALFALAGCASHSPPIQPPGSWAPIESGSGEDDCPRLSGTYANVATAATSSDLESAPRLSEIFGRVIEARYDMAGREVGVPEEGDWPEIVADPISVSFRQTLETLAVTFTNARGEGSTLNFRRYHYTFYEARMNDFYLCSIDDGMPRLWFWAAPYGADIQSFGGGGYPPAPIGGASGVSISVRFLRSIDGSLVLQFERTESWVVLLIVVPIWSTRSESTWYLYPGIDADPDAHGDR